ncbi:MAG: heavy-metal-associated domain-containing protein [Casimicrobium sp.]|jgi:copper chaperone CopZ
MQSMTSDIHGMSCGGCVGGVKRALEKVDGVSDVAVSLTPGQASLSADASLASAGQIVAAITKLGYHAKLRSAETMGASA